MEKWQYTQINIKWFYYKSHRLVRDRHSISSSTSQLVMCSALKVWFSGNKHPKMCKYISILLISLKYMICQCKFPIRNILFHTTPQDREREREMIWADGWTRTPNSVNNNFLFIKLVHFWEIVTREKRSRLSLLKRKFPCKHISNKETQYKHFGSLTRVLKIFIKIKYYCSWSSGGKYRLTCIGFCCKTSQNWIA